MQVVNPKNCETSELPSFKELIVSREEEGKKKESRVIDEMLMKFRCGHLHVRVHKYVSIKMYVEIQESSKVW